MRSVWNPPRVSVKALFWLILPFFVFYGGCKQKAERAESRAEGPAKGAAEVQRDDNKQPEDKIDLKILYAGHVGSEREQDFSRFLRGHFAEVAVTDLAAFREEQADGFDVVILTYDGDGFKAPRPNISPGFSRPMMTVGVPGAFICGNLSLKMAYL